MRVHSIHVERTDGPTACGVLEVQFPGRVRDGFPWSVEGRFDRRGKHTGKIGFEVYPGSAEAEKLLIDNHDAVKFSDTTSPQPT